MSKRPARPNAFNGEARTTAQVGQTRAVVEKFLEDNHSHYSAEHIADATGLNTRAVRKKLAELAVCGTAISTKPGSIKTTYQHREHWNREHRISSPQPIRNSTMETGNTTWWRKQMATFNKPPRAA